MNIQNLLPKDKFDIETVENLKNFSFEEIQPIVPELLEWLQDCNWPISKPILNILLPFTDKISFNILEILKGSDEVWKYWILMGFGNSITNNLIIEEIKRIAFKPSENEINEGNAEIALELVQKNSKVLTK